MDKNLLAKLIECLEDAIGDLETIREVRGDIIMTDRYEAALNEAKAAQAAAE